MLSQARQMVEMMKASGNPQEMVNKMVSQNPQIKEIINQYGGDAKTAFYRYAEANGVNPNDILQMMR